MSTREPSPAFSVVIPTRGRPGFLSRAIASVRRQSVRDLELVVVDDGPGEGDGLRDVPEMRGAVVLRTGGAGQVPARNLGVAQARGGAIAFLDDDDWWDDADHLARLRQALAGGGARLRLRPRGAGNRRSGADRRAGLRGQRDAASIRRDNLLMVSGVAYERRLHATVGAFDERLPYYWDWDFYLRLLAAGIRFTASGGTGVRVSARAGTVSATKNEAARRADLARLSAKHGLVDIRLRNHESIAVDQNAPAAGEPQRGSHVRPR